jgi:hypothetical protein
VSKPETLQKNLLLGGLGCLFDDLLYDLCLLYKECAHDSKSIVNSE